MYKWVAGSISIVADDHTRIPGTTRSVFGYFGASDPLIENGTVAFLGYDPGYLDGGIYRVVNGVFDLVAGASTPVPDGAGTFVAPWFLFSPRLKTGAVAFCWRYGVFGGAGLYTDIGGTLTRVIDRQTLVPGGVGYFNLAGNLTSAMDAGNVFFVGGDSLGVQAVFKWNAGALERLFDMATPLPVGDHFLRFGSLDADAGRLVFVAQYQDGPSTASGLFQWQGGNISLLYTSGDPLPEFSIPATGFDSPVLDGSTLAFVVGGCPGQSCPQHVQGLFYQDAAGLRFVIGNKDTLEGRVVKSVSIKAGAVSGGRIAIRVTFEDNLEALYLATKLTDFPGGEGVIVNIDAQVNGDAPWLNRLRLRIPAGSWYLRRVNPLTHPLARYWAWTPSVSSPSWRTVFRYRSQDGAADAGCGYDPSVVYDPGSCDATPENAYDCTVTQKPECFTFGPFVLATEQVVEFWIGDNIVTDNGGGVSLLLTGGVSDTADGELRTMPPVGAPYPNPSPGETRLNLRLPRAGVVSITIADARGRLMKAIRPGLLSAGTHFVTWDGLDERGARVASGTYFYVVRVGDEALGSQRMVIQR